MALTLFALTLLAFNRLLLLIHAFDFALFCERSELVLRLPLIRERSELVLLYAFDLLCERSELSLLLLCERSELTLTFVLMFLTFMRAKRADLGFRAAKTRYIC